MDKIELDAAVAAWTAVQSGFEIKAIHQQEETNWRIEDRLREEVRVMLMATRAFLALRELHDELFDFDIRSLVMAACGPGPFNCAGDL